MENETDVSIFILCDDYQLIEPNEYDKKIDGKGYFLVVTNEELNPEYGENNTICISSEYDLLINKNDTMIQKILDMRQLQVEDWEFCEERLRKKYNKDKNAKKTMTFKQYFDENVDIFIENNEELFGGEDIWMDVNENYDDYAGFIFQVDDQKIENMKYYSDEDEEQLYHEFNGWQNTNKILNARQKMFNEYQKTYNDKFDYSSGVADTIEQYMPAITVAHHTRVNYGNKKYHGYIPTIGQLFMIQTNLDKIGKTMSLISNSENEFSDYINNQGNVILSSSQHIENDKIWHYSPDGDYPIEELKSRCGNLVILFKVF